MARILKLGIGIVPYGTNGVFYERTLNILKTVAELFILTTSQGEPAGHLILKPILVIPGPQIRSLLSQFKFNLE